MYKRSIFLICLSCLMSVSVFAQKDIVTVFEGIKIKNERRAETIYYYENNWMVFRKQALRKGYIHSYEFLVSKSDGGADFDIVLITRFKNQKQYDKAEERFQKLIKARGGLRLLNEYKPGDFRINSFVKMGKSTVGIGKR